MQIVNVTPRSNGKKTEVTIEMSAAEADSFLRALRQGKLGHLGIKSEGVTVEPLENQSSHAVRLKQR